jgi:hypothetical protein
MQEQKVTREGETLADEHAHMDTWQTIQKGPCVPAHSYLCHTRAHVHANAHAAPARG